MAAHDDARSTASADTAPAPRPWVLFAAFAIVIGWSAFREWPLTTSIALAAVGILAVHVARLIAQGRPGVVEVVVMAAGIALILSGPNHWIAASQKSTGEAARYLFSLPAITLIGGPLIAANMIWLTLAAGGTWQAFRDSGRWTPWQLLAISTISSALYLLVEIGRAMGRA